MKDRVDREEALARLAAPQLKRESEARGAACPDAGVIAAYCDRTLGADERGTAEVHFAACGRCQQILAGLARAGVPQPQLETEKSPVRWWGWRPNWTWLAPAAAVLALGLLWTAVRPSLFPVGPSSLSSEQSSPAAAVANEAAPVPAAEPRKDVALSAAPAVPAQATKTAAAPVERRPSAPPVLPPVARPRQDVAAAPSPPAVAAGKGVAAENVPVPEMAKEAERPAATPTLAGLPKTAEAPQAVEGTALRAQAPGRAGNVRAVAAAGVGPEPWVVTSPDPNLSWRIGPASVIERTADGGRTWTRQDPDVSVRILAGSAPSPSVCWLVGRRGAVLRTIDNGPWQLLSPPTSADLISVSARDDMTATVVAAGGRRYTTTDGGRTWTPQ